MLPFERAEEKHPGNQGHPQPGAGRRMKRVLLPAPGQAFALARSVFLPLPDPVFAFCPVRPYPSRGSSFAVIDF